MVTTVGQLVTAYAQQKPPAVALVDGERRFTYAELSGRAGRLAERLQAAGTVDGGLIGVCLPRSAELVVAMLAVAKAGGVHLALDPAQPAARTSAMLDVARPGLLIVAGSASEDRLRVDRLHPAEAATVLPDVGYVVFTSGSTGSPKGVMGDQQGLVNLAQWHASAFGVRSGTRCSQVAAPGFDASLWETWGCLAAGGCLVVAPHATVSHPGRLQQWLLSNRIEVSFVPTLIAEPLLEMSWPTEPGLRVLLTGGDRLRRRPSAELPFTVVNNYGVSEASVVSTSGVTAPGDSEPTIGRPVPGVDCFILDRQLQPVQAGASGELVVSGPWLARGYLGDEKLTAAKFPVLDLDGAPRRCYRTGDVVVATPTGEICYLHRLDDQVQVSGQRIEPAEVAACLEQHNAVDRCLVLPTGDGQLAAFVQPSAGQTVDPATLREHLLDRLPLPMIPAVVRVTAEFPVDGNGKVDRLALLATLDSEPASTATGGSADPTDFDTLLLQRVAGFVAEALGQPEVDPDGNFLQLGGHSLLGAQLVTTLSDEFGVELTLRALFVQPTARGLAEQIRDLLVEQVKQLDDPAALPAVGASGSWPTQP